MRRKPIWKLLAALVVTTLAIFGGYRLEVYAQNRTPLSLNMDIGDNTAHATAVNASVYSDIRLVGAAQTLAADSAGSATNTLVNSGMSWPVEANATYTLQCDISYTSGTSGGGLALSVNGPGTPVNITQMADIATAATTYNLNTPVTGTSWQSQIGTASTTTTTAQRAHYSAQIATSLTVAGTLALQYADINTTGTVTLKRGSWCLLQ